MIGEDCARIALASGTGSHGENVRRVRSPEGKAAAIWFGGGQLLPEAELVDEITDRYGRG